MKSQLGAGTLHNVSLIFGELVVELAECLLSGAAFDSGRTSIDEATLNTLSAKSSSLAASAMQVALRGATASKTQQSAKEVRLQAFEARGQFPQGAEPKGEATSDRPRSTDWSVLDGVSGRLAFDIDLAYTAAVIGDRAATHRFNIPIDQGCFEYGRLEEGLAALEDAAIDLELQGDRLILEKDLPLVPFDNTTLLAWPLDGEGRKLAEAGRARLRDLPHFERKKSSGESGSAKEQKFKLRSLEIRSNGTELALAGGGACQIGTLSLTLGAEDKPAIENLSIEGTLSHDKAQSEETAIRVGLKGLCLGLRGAIGGRSLEIALLEIPELSIQVDFNGFRPLRWAVRASQGIVRGASIS